MASIIEIECICYNCLTDGIWVAATNVIGAKMEWGFGPKFSGEYKLSGCTDVYIHDCYRWFLELIWMHSKTYTLSIRARAIQKTLEITTVAWV